MKTKRICIIGASGKLGQYMIQHCIDRGYQINAVCRPQSIDKLNRYRGCIELFPGRSDDKTVIREAVAGCDAVLTVLVPWGVNDYSSGTAQAVLDHAPTNARLIFSCGWHISLDGEDSYSWTFKAFLKVFGFVARLLRFADIDDQVEACKRIFASKRNWTVVRCSDIEEGESEGLPVWSEHVGDAILATNRTRRVDFALFMVHAIEDASLIHKAPAIVSQAAESAQKHLSIKTG